MQSDRGLVWSGLAGLICTVDRGLVWFGLAGLICTVDRGLFWSGLAGLICTVDRGLVWSGRANLYSRQVLVPVRKAKHMQHCGAPVIRTGFIPPPSRRHWTYLKAMFIKQGVAHHQSLHKKLRVGAQNNIHVCICSNITVVTRVAANNRTDCPYRLHSTFWRRNYFFNFSTLCI